MNTMRIASPIAFFLLISFNCLFAQSSLSIEQMMRGDSFVGKLPENPYWAPDGKTLYFTWKEAENGQKWYKVTLGEKVPQLVSTTELIAMPPAEVVFDRALERAIYEKNGDIFLVDVTKGTTTQITNTVLRQRNPVFSGDEQAIVFVQDHNLFSWDIARGVLTQLTDFQPGKQKPEAELPAQEQWLQNDQLTYFEVLKEKQQQREKEKQVSGTTEPKRPLPIYFGKDRIFNQQLSPDGRFITFSQMENMETKSTAVPDFVTESGYVVDLPSRDKVGSPQPQVRLGVYDLQKDSVYYLASADIPGIYEKPAFLKEYANPQETWSADYPNPRKVNFMGPVFNQKGDKAVVVIRSHDNKDRWLMSLDMASGKLDLLDRQRDEAWIGGPGIGSWNLAAGNLGWLSDDKTLWFQSEETGFSHLYTLNVASKKKKALTEGNFEVQQVWLYADKTSFLLKTNQIHPGEQHIYSMPATGGKLEQLTSLPGSHEFVPSPDGQHLAIRYSYSNKPWELYLMPAQKGEEWQQITQSTTKEFSAYSWRTPELITFPAEDGTAVPARIYQPNPQIANGKAVIFVHGAGYLQNAHKWWSSYFREYMFHNFLVDHGYTVLDIDYRGSAGYGRDWRTAIYRHMGGKDLSDHIDGARFLVEKHGIAAGKIGIYGGSYGGFITLMALFTSPGTFKCGAALRSVTDWAHYNHGYTSNILNTPVEDSLAYYRSSPIYHAEGLQDNLLILHGMVDRNVQFQDVVRLSQRLIELGKDNWEMAVFPVEDHGFVTPSSWTDEYKRIFKLFQENLGD